MEIKTALEKIGSVLKYAWGLLLVMLTGIFLRAYNYSDWLRFCPDQVRDAGIIRGALESGGTLPLLGAQAGSTNFYLGPLHYYFQIISSKLMGISPSVLAYPDLIFSILTIPLSFFFFRKLLNRRKSLILTLFLSLSFFMIMGARHASNINAVPFFVLLFLYASNEMMDEKNKKSLFWPVIFGLSIGAGIQLHTLLFLTFPVVAFVILTYNFWRKRLDIRTVVLVALAFLAVNFSQILYEINSEQSNVVQLFRGVDSESKIDDDLSKNVGHILSCQVQANLHIATSLENVDNCGNIFKGKRYLKAPGMFGSTFVYYLTTALSLLLSIAGYFFWVMRSRTEINPMRRRFLRILAGYNIISLMVMVPVASQIESHYFVVLFIVPFVMAGLIMEQMEKSEKGFWQQAAKALVVIFIISNLFVVWKESEAYRKEMASDTDNCVLGEMHPMAAYIAVSSEGHRQVYMAGKEVYLNRFYKSLNYLSQISGTAIIKLDEKKEPDAGVPLFYITGSESNDNEIGESIGDHVIKDMKEFQKIKIFKLDNQKK